MTKFKTGDKVVQTKACEYNRYNFPAEEYPVLTVRYNEDDELGFVESDQDSSKAPYGACGSRFELIREADKYVYIHELTPDELRAYDRGGPGYDPAMDDYLGTIQKVGEKYSYLDNCTRVAGWVWRDNDLTEVTTDIDVSKLEVNQIVYLQNKGEKLREAKIVKIKLSETSDTRYWVSWLEESTGRKGGWYYELNGEVCGNLYLDTIVASMSPPSATLAKLEGVYTAHDTGPRPGTVSLLPSAPTIPQTGIDAILAERGSRYGEFDEHARITQAIKAALVSGDSWEDLSDAQKEALEMVAHKLGRIVNGDPNYKDSWTDIIGYTKLVEETL